jgi:hypothetical protein
VSALTVIPGSDAVGKLPPDHAVSMWVAGGGFVSVTRTPLERRSNFRDFMPDSCLADGFDCGAASGSERGERA